MTGSDFEVMIEQKSAGSWEARIASIPDLFGRGETHNEALADLWTAFGKLYEAQRSELSSTGLKNWGAIWQKVFHGVHAKYDPQPKSAPGDFYVESGCCTACGVPQHVAPDLVGWTVEPFVSCYWKKQPETKEEFEQAFKIFDGQELGCHHYRGHDPDIQLRVGTEQCDYPLTVVQQGVHRASVLYASWGWPTQPFDSDRTNWLGRLIKRIRGRS
jgi:predicted RNase H-like HicB family nuclease